MMTNGNMKEIEELFRMYSPEELASSLDRVLFTATLSYLDPTGGGTTDEMVDDVYIIHYLLESLRKCCKPSE